MPGIKEYQGHRSWNSWNTALYIQNDYSLYSLARDCVARSRSMDAAVKRFIRESRLVGSKTPDGAVYNPLNIKLAIDDLEIEHLLATKPAHNKAKHSMTQPRRLSR